ncbi:hypothetical protein F2Q70_00005516 [Brassica cretica]|uniref:Uncharacterized protein n=1 Tax=Brassica cretica TaxID=69181 RepID=A0A8S9IIR0_BRACR|nr:hypothetical protein F2Q70_00005516 [Brassica cretica]
MAKREISSTLRNLKFMQRSALKEEKKKKKIDDDNANFTPSPGSVSKKCVVITDWDPQPRALLGRLSFQSFNPSIEKLNEEESITGGKTDASPTGSSDECFGEGDDQGEGMMMRKSVFTKLGDQGDFYGENETLIYLEKERSKLVNKIGRLSIENPYPIMPEKRERRRNAREDRKKKKKKLSIWIRILC